MGCFSTESVGALVRVNGIMKKEDYRDILEENLKQSARNLEIRHRWILQQDNDPKHTSKFVSKWLADERVNVLPHREKRLVESKHVWFIFVLTHVLSCRELFNELNQLTK